MADSPRLHEIAVELSPIVPPELGSLNATFNPWSEEFALPQPRPLAPVKLFGRDRETMDENKSDAPPRDWADDAEMEKSEAAWGQREITRRLEQLLGKGWRRISGIGAGHCHVTISCGEDIDRLPEIIGCLRQFAAAARHPWNFLLIVDSLAQYERDMGEIYRAEGEEFNAEREREEWEYRRQRRIVGESHYNLLGAIRFGAAGILTSSKILQRRKIPKPGRTRMFLKRPPKIQHQNMTSEHASIFIPK